MSRWNLTWLLGISAAALVGLSLTISAPSRDNNLQKKHENIKLLVDVLEEVQSKYVKELDAEKMREWVEYLVNRGLERLDPYSAYINAEDFKRFQNQNKGKYGGVGILLTRDRTDQLMVETAMAGSPAYEAGILAGDLILKVDGKPTETMLRTEVVNLIQGEPGSKVTLTILHEGSKKPEDIEITRAEIKIESVMGDKRMKENLKEWDFWVDPNAKIGYVRVTAFTETTTADLTKIVDALQRAGLKGLVIDLRDNGGGLLSSAVKVSSLFMEDGKNVVTTKGRSGNGPPGSSEDVYNAKRENGDVKPGTYYPIAILVNRWSASASEIVAAALQDHLRAIIIGERTYGKGSVQHVIAMEGGASALKLTTASYWRPSGKNIHRFVDSKDTDEWGVKPSQGFEIKLSDDERREYYKWRRERDIIRRPGQPAPKDEALAKKDFRDRVLDKAVEYLQGAIKKNEGARAPDGAPPADGAGPVVRVRDESPMFRRAEGQFVERQMPQELRRGEWP